MKLKYYGTAAAEGFPALFCDCETCNRARKAGGRNLRKRSHACVDGKILLDFGPDTYSSYLYDGLDLPNIKNCLITHSHEDHFCISPIPAKTSHYAHGDIEPLMFYMTKTAAEDERYNIGKTIRAPHIAKENVLGLTEIEPFAPFEVEGYKVTAYVADHDKLSGAVFYSLEKDGKGLLYANDTGAFPASTWKYLEENKPFFNVVSLDCCNGVLTYKSSHMGLNGCSEVKEKLIEIGCADENTVFILHHFSHNCRVTYDEIVPLAKELGFEVAFDTMEIEF